MSFVAEYSEFIFFFHTPKKNGSIKKRIWEKQNRKNIQIINFRGGVGFFDCQGVCDKNEMKL